MKPLAFLPFLSHVYERPHLNYLAKRFVGTHDVFKEEAECKLLNEDFHGRLYNTVQSSKEDYWTYYEDHGFHSNSNHVVVCLISDEDVKGQEFLKNFTRESAVPAAAVKTLKNGHYLKIDAWYYQAKHVILALAVMGQYISNAKILPEGPMMLYNNPYTCLVAPYDEEYLRKSGNLEEES